MYFGHIIFGHHQIIPRATPNQNCLFIYHHKKPSPQPFFHQNHSSTKVPLTTTTITTITIHYSHPSQHLLFTITIFMTTIPLNQPYAPLKLTSHIYSSFITFPDPPPTPASPLPTLHTTCQPYIWCPQQSLLPQYGEYPHLIIWEDLVNHSHNYFGTM